MVYDVSQSVLVCESADQSNKTDNLKGTPMMTGSLLPVPTFTSILRDTATIYSSISYPCVEVLSAAFHWNSRRTYKPLGP